MSSPGSVHTKDSSCGSGHHKKSKRKRHRNKFRNSTVRKKRTKKFYCGKKSNSFKLEASKLNLESEKIMSNWYWSNYKKAVEWQDRHKTAHWKACALALMEENRHLLQIINDMQHGMAPEVSVTQSNLGEHRHFNREILKLSPGSSTRFHIPADGDIDADRDEVDVGEDNNEEGDDNEYDNIDNEEDDVEFEMSEEMIHFFEQSYRHKMDMKKLKEKELLNKAEEEIKQVQTNKIKRYSEMNLLYGDGASMIIGMETAVQLSFDKYCDTKSPKYWPNIPFRL